MKNLIYGYLPVYVKDKKNNIIKNYDYDYKLSTYLEELQTFYLPNCDKPRILVEKLESYYETEFILSKKTIVYKEPLTNFIFESKYIEGVTGSAIYEIDDDKVFGFYDKYTEIELIKLKKILDYVFYRRGNKPIVVQNDDNYKEKNDEYIKQLVKKYNN